MSVGVHSERSMSGADIMVGCRMLIAAHPSLQSAYLQSSNNVQNVVLLDQKANGYSLETDAAQDLTLIAWSVPDASGVWSVTFKRPLSTGDKAHDQILTPNTAQYFLFAHGDHLTPQSNYLQTELTKHEWKAISSQPILLLQNQTDVTGLFGEDPWTQYDTIASTHGIHLIIRGSCSSHLVFSIVPTLSSPIVIDFLVSPCFCCCYPNQRISVTPAILMFVAWSVLVPAGMYMSQFWRMAYHETWFQWHVGTMVAACLSSTVALAVVIPFAGQAFSGAHHVRYPPRLTVL